MCLNVSDTQKTSQNPGSAKEAADMESYGNDDLHFHSLAGGSIVKLSPLFSEDGDNCLIVCNDTVRVYQVSTGTWLRDLEKSERNLVAVQFQTDNPKLLYGCPEDGNVIVWKWRSGVKERRIQLQFRNPSTVSTFNLIPIDVAEGQQLALATYWDNVTQNMQIDTFDLETGTRIDEFDIPLLPEHYVAMSNFQFFATVHRNRLHIGFLRNNTHTLHKNPVKHHFTCVECHPSEPVVATGDNEGQIRLWRNVYTQKAISTLYHWHATPVKTIAFSEFGSHFYSGAKEFVLVKWAIDRPENKQFLPRLRGAPRNITLGPKNNNIALALSDNQIQFLDSNFQLAAVVQSFTFVQDDETGFQNFPCGIKYHPNNNCLVLNGRMGQLQFYSTQSQSLLYNMDITTENALAVEHDKVIFNTRVTKVAISQEWLVTCECWNDGERSQQVRMKFWRLDESAKKYILNTNALMPHDKDLVALQLSTVHRAETVYCASGGRDRVLKLWANNREVYGKGVVWNCVGQRGYKNLPIGDLCFSKDGSSLITGFGRHIVIYSGVNLRDIRCVLTAPGGFDGEINRLGVIIDQEFSAKKSTNGLNTKNIIKSEASKLVMRLLQTEDSKEKEELRKILFGSLPKEEDEQISRTIKPIPELGSRYQESVFEEIFDYVDLDLQQKLRTFNGLGLEWGVSHSYAEQRATLFTRFHGREEKLEEAVQVLADNKNLRVLRDRFEKMTFATQIKKSELHERPMMLAPEAVRNNINTSSSKMLPGASKIKSILLGAGEFPHLLIVTTINRVLIWNLLTLKIQTILKLSCEHICIDPISGLLAAFTKNGQLFVFPPNCPIPVYSRTSMPPIYGAIWVPRNWPRSNYSDWQASSQLMFLTKQQELMCFVSDTDEEVLGKTMAHMQGSHPLSITQKPFGSVMSRHGKGAYSQTPLVNGSGGGSWLLKKSSVKELINLLPHAMAPLQILCKGYFSSVLNKEIDGNTDLAGSKHAISTSNGSSEKIDSDSDSDVEMFAPTGIPVIRAEEMVMELSSNHFDPKVESKLGKIAKINFNFRI